jgi:hypothetical protein
MEEIFYQLHEEFINSEDFNHYVKEMLEYEHTLILQSENNNL